MGFGGIGDMMFILVLGLLLFGPKKLPEIARQVGKVLGDFKRASAEFQAQLNDEVRKLESSIADADNNTNSIASPYLQGTAARNSAPQYALEPNSGQHEGDIPLSTVSLGDETPPPIANGSAESDAVTPVASTNEVPAAITPSAAEEISEVQSAKNVHGS
jgi:sec-independent protein translocase protein TatB